MSAFYVKRICITCFRYIWEIRSVGLWIRLLLIHIYDLYLKTKMSSNRSSINQFKHCLRISFGKGAREDYKYRSRFLASFLNSERGQTRQELETVTGHLFKKRLLHFISNSGHYCFISHDFQKIYEKRFFEK